MKQKKSKSFLVQFLTTNEASCATLDGVILSGRLKCFFRQLELQNQYCAGLMAFSHINGSWGLGDSAIVVEEEEEEESSQTYWVVSP